METIKLQQLTLTQANSQFPCSVNADIKGLNKQNKKEPNYLRLVTYEGKLYACTYEISYMGWSVWQDSTWQDLDNVDCELDQRFQEADFEFIPAT